MARPKTRKEGDKRVNIDLPPDVIKTIAKDAIDRDLPGFKPNAERILKEAAEKINKQKK